MGLPVDSAKAEQFVVIASHRTSETLERKTYVFSKHSTLEEVFSSVFAEGRTESLGGNTLPYLLEILPDLSCLPVPKTISEQVMEQIGARAKDPVF